jgi:hypothetical protein
LLAGAVMLVGTAAWLARRRKSPEGPGTPDDRTAAHT